MEINVSKNTDETEHSHTRTSQTRTRGRPSRQWHAQRGKRRDHGGPATPACRRVPARRGWRPPAGRASSAATLPLRRSEALPGTTRATPFLPPDAFRHRPPSTEQSESQRNPMSYLPRPRSPESSGSPRGKGKAVLSPAPLLLRQERMNCPLLSHDTESPSHTCVFVGRPDPPRTRPPSAPSSLQVGPRPSRTCVHLPRALPFPASP